MVNQIDGPVLLVGLVFVAAFAPDEGERLGEVEANSTDSILNTALVQRQYPTGQDSETAVEFAINPALFREAFAADLPTKQTAVMARAMACQPPCGSRRIARAGQGSAPSPVGRPAPPRWPPACPA